MIIRKANKTDLDNIMLMYKSCVKGMIANDIDQWDETYPNAGVIMGDLIAQTYFVAIKNNVIIGGINIDLDQDKTYLDINWEDVKRYWVRWATLHIELKNGEVIKTDNYYDCDIDWKRASEEQAFDENFNEVVLKGERE